MTVILPSISLCVQQKNESHTGVEQHYGGKYGRSYPRDFRLRLVPFGPP